MLESSGSQTITRKSLHQELVDRLQLLIISGELAPGSKVPEKKLCEQFGVSRTPLREALKVMASEGLVRLEPNRGAWVTLVTVDEVEEVFPVLGALEALAGELACKHFTDQDIATIETLHQQMEQSYETRDLDAYFAINQQIHAAILAAARNETLAASCQALAIRIQRARYLANMSEERWSTAVQEHQKILQFVIARDSEQLGRALLDHMDTKRQSIIKWLQAQENVAVAE